MINLSAIMGRIAGKGVDSGPQSGASVPGEAGIATGGSFAALVQFATQAGPRPTQGELGLVVDNAGLPSAAPFDAAATLMGEAGATPALSLPTGGEAALWTQFAATAPTLQGKTGTANTGRNPQPAADPLAAIDPMASAVPVTPLGDAVSAESPEATSGQGDTPTGAEGASQAQTQAQAQAQTQIFGIPTGAAAMAAMAPWTGQRTAAETAPPPSLPQEGAAPAPGIASAAPIATIAQAAGETDARITKGGARFIAQPTTATPTPMGEAKPEGQTGDAVDSGTSGGRTSEQATTTVGATPPSSLGTTGAGVPLRMIVDSLPPGIQSTLSAGAIATVSGPSTGDQLGDRVIDMGVSGQWIDRMAREITALAEGSGHSRFTLNPPHLGRLQVDLWQGQDATSVRLVAETDEAARRLGEGRSALQADARMAALNLGSITIEKSAHSQDSARDSGSHRSGAEAQGQMQQQGAGQGQGNGQGQARSGNNQPQGEWVGRAFRHDQDQQGEAPPSTAARRAASDHVRFA